MFFLDSIFYELSVYFSVVSESFTVGGHDIFLHLSVLKMQDILSSASEIAKKLTF